MNAVALSMMEQHGGVFAKLLAQMYRVADDDRRAALVSTFRLDFDNYTVRAEARLQAYREQLRRLDTSYGFSDDHNEFKRGEAAMEAARAEQRAVDPDRKVWDEVMAERMQRAGAAA